jgi:hypothetical protein
MSTDVVNSYNIFVDTERNLNATSDGNSIMLSLNQTPITCSSNQYIRLTLQSFSMYKSFTNVNKNNNVFRITHDGATPQADLALFLPSLDYRSLNTLATQFATILGNQLAADIGGGTTFTISTTAPDALTPAPTADTDNIITFTLEFSNNHLLTQLLIRTLVEDGDSFEVLGTNRIRADDGTPAWNNLNSVFTDVATHPKKVTVKCLYNAQLSSQQNMYLRTDINNTNIQTESFVAGSTDNTSASSLSSSNILGRMVIDNQFVNFTTGTQMEYFVSLTTKQITHMRLYITDSHGRDIPPNVQTLNNADQSPVYPALTAQSTLGNRSWEGVIKVDIVQFMGGQNQKLESAPVVHSVPARFGTEPLNKLDYGESGFPDVDFSRMRMK